MPGTNGFILQDRDRHLLRELAVMRFVDREQAKCVAPFHSTTRANARLLQLTRARFLRRFSLGTTDSGKKFLYSLSKRGAQIVEVPYRGLRRVSGETMVADFLITHQFRINEVFCTVKYRPIPNQNVQFVRWIAFQRPIDTNASLIPDGYFELRTPTTIVCLFLEIDLGHEGRAVWRKKVQAYLNYAIAGDFERQFVQRQFRTLVITSSQRRMASLQDTTAQLTEKIFWFTTFERIAQQGFWSAVWERVKDRSQQSLV